MSEKLRIHVYTGNGKGKTTAALGMALRVISRGFRVFMVQFLKRPGIAGEHSAAAALAPELTLKPMGTGKFIGRRRPDTHDLAMVELGLEEARKAMLSGDYQMVILDEANVAVSKGLLDVARLLEFIDALPDDMELIITGRNVHPDVVARADVVTEMKKIKHYFDSGRKACKGIDY